MKRGLLSSFFLAFLGWGIASSSSRADELTPVPDVVTTQLVPLLKTYCTTCHNAQDEQSGLDLSVFQSELSLLKQRQTWQGVARMVRALEMPPKDKPQPTAEERESVLSLIDKVLNKVDCGQQLDPGRVTIRRLNRVEYNNTIRDLTGVQLSPADDFPADDIGYGFDHIGDVLSLPTVLFEKYFAAAERIADAALREGDIENGPIRRYPSREMKWVGPGESPERGKYGRLLFLEGELQTEMYSAIDADYVVNVRALSIPKVAKAFQVELRLDGMPVKKLDFSEMRSKTYPVRVRLPAGQHIVSVGLVTVGTEPEEPPAPKTEAAAAEQKKIDWQNPVINFEYLDVEGPIDESPTLSEQLILICRPKPDGSDEAACAEQIIQRFLQRAFRHPVNPADLQTYVELFQQRRASGGSYTRSLKDTIVAILISPRFLFRLEDDPADDGNSVSRTLDDFELASRLSYFLWSTMPDDELAELAAQGQLRNPETLRAQIRRMLTDSRRQTLIDNFTGQWLQLRNLDILNPDKTVYPDFDVSLRQSMRRETELFFEYLVHEDRSVLELIDADYTFANDRLAKHYGLAGSFTSNFQKVRFDNDQRGGVLTQGSILTVTSNPTRTSPVKRGKWVLENILGSAPPPPPPTVDPLDESPAAAAKGSLRERMVLHRSKAGCASCHQRMDPLGFGFENFDGIGRWRTEDGGFPIDASGDLPSGQSFKTPKELRGILLSDRDEFSRCLTEKLMTYALGRGLEYYDKCAVDIICNHLKQNDYRFSALVEAIVKSDPFQRKAGVKGQP